MKELIIQTFWFLLPAGIANMSPLLFKWTTFLNNPVDFNLKLNQKPIFGKNKTYRGFIIAIISGISTVYLQKYFYQDFKNISLINYQTINIFLLGFLLGFGAMLGDLIKSFTKRRINIKPGEPWIPFDQIDWILGAIILTSCYQKISLKHQLTALILFGLLHPLINLIGYYLKVKKNKF